MFDCQNLLVKIKARLKVGNPSLVKPQSDFECLIDTQMEDRFVAHPLYTAIVSSEGTYSAFSGAINLTKIWPTFESFYISFLVLSTNQSERTYTSYLFDS